MLYQQGLKKSKCNCSRVSLTSGRLRTLHPGKFKFPFLTRITIHNQFFHPVFPFREILDIHLFPFSKPFSIKISGFKERYSVPFQLILVGSWYLGDLETYSLSFTFPMTIKSPYITWTWGLWQNFEV